MAAFETLANLVSSLPWFFCHFSVLIIGEIVLVPASWQARRCKEF
jgi:hypothetical protein